MAEEPVNNKTFKDLIAEQKKTTIAIEKSMMDNEQRAAFEALEREKFQKSSEANKRGAETKRLNALKSQDPNSAAGKETKKESNSYLRDTFKTFLGKGSELAKGLGSIGEGLKAKVKSGLSGIMDAIKTGAFIAFLGAVSAFLKSDLFKDMKDKYLPVIADGVKSLFDTLKGIVDGFFDEDGNFSAAAGFKNIFDELSTAFTNFGTNLKESFLDENGDLTLKSAIAGIPDAFGVILGAFMNPVTGLLALLAPKMFFGSAVWIGKKLFGGALRLARGGFGLLFRALGSFTTALDTTALDMDGQVSKSKKTGAFRRGLGGTGGKFRRLFRVLGKFGGLLGGVGLTMLSFLDPSSLGKVFTTVGDSFKSLFSVVGDFAKSIGRVATAAASATADAIKSALKSVAKIGAKKPPKPVKLTRSQLDAISGRGDFKIKPSAISTPRVDNTPKPNPIKAQTRVTELAPTKTFPRFSNPPKIGIEPPAPKISVAPRLPTLDTVIPKVPMINLKSSAKIKPTVKKLTKASMAASLLQYGGLGAIKMLPGIGIAAGLIFSASRLLAGDKVGAAMELGGTFAPSVTGLPIDAAIMARDIYEDQFGVYPEQEQDSELRKERMRTIAKFLSDKLRKKKAMIGASPPALTAEKRAELIQKRSVFNYAATDLPSFAEYEKSAPLLRVNPSFDRNSDGVYNEKEFRRASAATRRSRGNESVLDSQGGAMFLSQTINAPSQQQVFKIDKTIVGDAYADKIANR